MRKLTEAQKNLIAYMYQNNGILCCKQYKGKKGIASYATIQAVKKAGWIVSCHSVFTSGLDIYAVEDMPLPDGFVRV